MDERSNHTGQRNSLTATLRGILFDFDGTLANTMEGHYLAWKSALAEHEIAIAETDYYPLEGLDLHEVAKMYAKGPTWTEESINELVQKKKDYYVSLQTVNFYPGVELLISELNERDVPIAIVTAGHLDQLESTVPNAFLKQFNSIITGDQVSKGKPNPEPYLKGANALGLTPPECIAVENAPLGVQSAKGASIYCIGICSTVGRAVLVEADEILERFEDLRNSLKFRQVSLAG